MKIKITVVATEAEKQAWIAAQAKVVAPPAPATPEKAAPENKKDTATAAKPAVAIR